VPFTLIHSGKYKTEDKLKIHTILKLNTTQKKQKHKTQQNKTTLVKSPLMTLGQEMRWTSTTLPIGLSTTKRKNDADLLPILCTDSETWKSWKRNAQKINLSYREFQGRPKNVALKNVPNF